MYGYTLCVAKEATDSHKHSTGLLNLKLAKVFYCVAVLFSMATTL